MTTKRRLSVSLLIFILFGVMPETAKSAENQITPEQQITVEVVQQGPEKPEWKMLWDRARMLVRQNYLEEAKQSYEELFTLKPNIVAATWEYCKLLLRLEEWEESTRVIEGLLELEPNNQEFLLAGGEIALANNHNSKATKYFGQVLESDPVGPFSSNAIQGLVEALRKLNNPKAAYLLLEQYVQRGNDVDALLLQLGKLSLELRYYKRAEKYYLKLVKRHPDNKDFVFQIAHIYEHRGDFDNAANYWQNYLALDPDFPQFHLKLARYYLDKESVREAMPHLEKVYNLGGRKDSDLALDIANLYDVKLGRKDKALLFYERYSFTHGRDQKIYRKLDLIRGSLAEEYLPIVENGAADSLWRDLDFVTVDRTNIFVRIARLLQNKNNYAAEQEVIEILYNHNKIQDLNLIYRLAELYDKAGQTQQSYELLLDLDSKAYANKEYLRKKAEIEKLNKDEIQALHTYIRYLNYESGDLATVSEALAIAGDLGLVEKVDQLWENLPQADFTAEELLAVKLQYVHALRSNSLYFRADQIYAELFSEYIDNPSVSSEIYYHLAETLKHRGFYFKAEQLYRQNLARNMMVSRAIAELARLAMKQGQQSQAKSWLDLLAKRNGIDDLEDSAAVLPEEIHFLYIEYLIGSQEYDDAFEQIEEHVQYRRTENGPTDFDLKSDLYLCKILFFQEEYEECLEIISKLESREKSSPETYVLSQIIHSRLGSDRQHHSGSNSEQQVALTARLERVVWFKSYREYDKALAEIEYILQQMPESLISRVLQIQLLAELARFADAYEQLSTLLTSYPDEEYFGTLQLDLEFQSGRFAEVVRKVPVKMKKIEETEDIPKIQNSQDTYFYRKLLLARALWAENRREEAIDVYNSLLAAPVDTIFLEKIEVEKINFNLLPLKKSFWNVLTFTSPEGPDPMPVVMEPKFVAQNIGEPIDNLAAGLYAKYRWQQLVKKELSAREAVKKRDYYQAEKKYLALLEKEKSPESVYGLAEIYDRLGLHGKAAELYQLMKEKGPLYPGLDESIQANLLKRQPRISTALEAYDKKGRDGYVNLKKRSYGIEGWISPTFDQEFSIQAYFNEYRTTEDNERLEKQRFVGAYNTYFENSTDINLKAGIDAPVKSGSKELVFNFELFHRINEAIEVYGRFEQDIVEDTLRSVTDSITFRDFEAGVKIDVFPRLFLGGDYRYRTYSDDNYQNRYKVWSQYHLFGELNQLKLNYSFELIRHGDDNLGREDDFSNVFAPDDQVYWSPKNYWQQEITVHFRHYLDKTPQPKTLMNYCSLDYSWGYDKNREQSHEIDLNIFLEISRHFLLKSNLRFLEGDDLEETQAVFSLIYRW